MSKTRRTFLNFTLAGLDELELFPTPEERQKAVNEVGTETRGRDFAKGMTILTLVAAGTAFLALLLGRALFTGVLPRALVDLVPAASAIIAALITMRLLHRWGARADLRRKLLRCGYDLRGLPPGGALCPECGTEPSVEATRLLTI